MDRRQFVQLGLAGAAGLAFGLPSAAKAQALTSLQFFIPAAPGGGWDQTGRSMEAVMRAEGIVQNFQFEHAPGAGGAVGLPKFVATKKGQANALMVGGMVMTGALIANKAPVKLTDVAPIARLTGEAEVIVVPADSPHKTLADLMKALKDNPTKVSWAGGSAGGTDHILVGLICKAAGVDPKTAAYVPYAGGGPAQAALLGNQVTAGVSGYGEFAEMVKAGKLRALGISSGTRISGIDVPTFKESGLNIELFNWRGVFGAPGVSEEARKPVVAAVDKLATSAAWKAELAKKDWTDLYLPGPAFATFLQEDIARVTATLKDLGLAS